MIDNKDKTQDSEWRKVVKKAKRQSKYSMLSNRDYSTCKYLLDSE